jgi:vacuolar-type H+-ATPase subunit I/STV1
MNCFTFNYSLNPSDSKVWTLEYITCEGDKRRNTIVGTNNLAGWRRSIGEGVKQFIKIMESTPSGGFVEINEDRFLKLANEAKEAEEIADALKTREKEVRRLEHKLEEEKKGIEVLKGKQKELEANSTLGMRA